jgi:signal transduction histidine kinase/DNA-binding LacI/PurR family transcriptional regulator
MNLMRIGFYLYNLDEDYQLALYESVRKEAAALNMDLICIQGEMFQSFSEPQGYPFDSSRQAGLDGMLIFSSIVFYRLDERMLPMLRDIAAHIPLVSIGMKLFDFPSVVINNRKPLEILIKHLVEYHGYRKLFYLGGQPDHPHNIEREKTFKKTIRAMKKEFPNLEERVFNSSFRLNTLISDFRDYITAHPGDSPDCILGGNDIIAISIQKLLQEQPDPHWHNCPVTGFDDVTFARLASPALTTIRQPLDAMGGLAVRMLRSLILGERIPRIIEVEPELVLRQSCGCAESGHGSGGEAQDLFSKMPALSPYYIHPMNILSHSLVLIRSLPEMAPHLYFFLETLYVKNFYLLLYPHPLHEQIGDTGLVVYQRKNYADEPCFEHAQTVQITAFLNDLIIAEGNSPQAWCLYYLQTGSEVLGLIIYEAQGQVYPQISSCVISIANTVMRLQNLESEKDRVLRLEREVSRRTSDLTELNEKLREEAERRQAVEAEVLRISEMERLRFSIDLHDDICQRLAGISMYCQSHIATSGKKQPFIRELTEQIDETLKRTRHYAHNSFPMELDTLGFRDTLGTLCEFVKKETACRCTYVWNARDVSFLTRAQEINICRIVQEALHNVVKHSCATEAAVDVFTEEAGDLVIRVRDNGRGMSNAGEKSCGSPGLRGGGLGLRSMEYRAHQAGAEYALKTAKGGGVCVELRIRHPEQVKDTPVQSEALI